MKTVEEVLELIRKETQEMDDILNRKIQIPKKFQDIDSRLLEFAFKIRRTALLDIKKGILNG